VKIAIFHNSTNHETAVAIGFIVAQQSVNVAFYDVEKIWDKNFTKNPPGLMDGVSHMLFMYSDDMSDLSAFVFFSGYCMGKGIPVLILENDSHLKLPENCMHLGMFLKLDSVEEFLISEKLRFTAAERKERARHALLDRGISCFDENFLLIIESGDSDAVQLFLDAGFNADLVDAKGVSALSHAVRSQVPDVAEILIKAGADVNRLSGDRGYSPLMDAAQKGDAAMIDLLVKNGANTDLKSKDGQTALVICAGRGDVTISTLLVEKGANPAIPDNLGMSAVGYAKLFKNEKLLELFNTPRA
jgi:uncharacterized protein